MKTDALIRKRSVRQKPEPEIVGSQGPTGDALTMFIADHDPLMSVKDVAAYLSVAEPTIWQYAREELDFPQPIKLTARCSRWRKSHINAWVASREDVE